MSIKKLVRKDDGMYEEIYDVSSSTKKTKASDVYSILDEQLASYLEAADREKVSEKIVKKLDKHSLLASEE